MARIPYADLQAPAAAPLVDRIVRERGSVLHLYQMLLHSPSVAEGWLNYLTAIRQKASLDGALRELVILRVAQMNGAQYEADQHVPYALKAGITQAQIDHLRDWRAAGCYSEREQRVLALTEAMTRDIQVDPALIADLRADLGETKLVEAVATVAAYNMVSRFLEALGIHSDDPR